MSNFHIVEQDIKMFTEIMNKMLKEIDETPGETYTVVDGEEELVLSKEKVKEQVCEAVKEAAVNYIINKQEDENTPDIGSPIK